jgi:hypothetical protein
MASGSFVISGIFAILIVFFLAYLPIMLINRSKQRFSDTQMIYNNQKNSSGYNNYNLLY